MKFGDANVLFYFFCVFISVLFDFNNMTSLIRTLIITLHCHYSRGLTVQVRLELNLKSSKIVCDLVWLSSSNAALHLYELDSAIGFQLVKLETRKTRTIFGD